MSRCSRRGLRAHHGLHLARVTADDGVHPLERAFHEGLVDVFLDQCARRAGADLALVEREHREALEALVEIGVVLAHHVREEDVRRLAAQLQRHRDDRFGSILRDQPPGCRLAGEGDLGDAVRAGQRFAGFEAETVDDVQNARGQDVGDHLGPHHDRRRRLFRRLDHHAIAGSECGGELPDRHQHREVPRDDLADHTEGLVEVIGDRVVVELAHRAFLRPDHRAEIAEMVDPERHVRQRRLADRLAVVPGLGEREGGDVVFHHLRDLHQHVRAIGHRGLAPGVGGGMGRIERILDIRGVGPGDLADRPAGDRREVLEIAPGIGGLEPAADEIVVAGLERAAGAGRILDVEMVFRHGNFLRLWVRDQGCSPIGVVAKYAGSCGRPELDHGRGRLWSHSVPKGGRRRRQNLSRPVEAPICRASCRSRTGFECDGPQREASRAGHAKRSRRSPDQPAPIGRGRGASIRRTRRSRRSCRRPGLR